MKYTIGVDVGGTHTDIVFLDDKKVIARYKKIITSFDIFSSLTDGIDQMLGTEDTVEAIFLGTTVATNALLQASDLSRVGVIRLSGHYPDSIDVAQEWPLHLKDGVLIDFCTVSGGHECDGREITPLDYKQLCDAAEYLIKKGSSVIVINGSFSFLYPAHEEESARFLSSLFPDISIYCSYRCGSLGFIERENAALLNAALKKIFLKAFETMNELASRYSCELFMVQNDGTIMSFTDALDFPIRTISAGPTNSCIGAAALTGLKDAFVVDVGGTSTDIGLLQNGYPRRSLRTVEIGGVTISAVSPDICSIALGGGTIVSFDKEFYLENKSVGKDLYSKARIFGGDILTLTDVAYCAGALKHISSQADPLVSPSVAQKILQQAWDKIEVLCFQLHSLQSNDVPIILVGGGAQLFSTCSFKKKVIIPEMAGVANAYGASLAKIAAVSDSIVYFSRINRHEYMASTEKELKEKVEMQGGKYPVLVEKIITPYYYARDRMARVYMTVVGER